MLLELDARDVDVLMRHQEHFEDAGFSLESFGGNTVQISGIPSFLKVGEARVFLTDLVDSIIDREGTGRVKRMAYEGFAAKVAEAGVKQTSWRLSEIEGLLADLFQCDLPYCDPSG